MKKIVLGKVRGNLFLCISFKFDYKVSSKCYSNFPSLFRSPLSLTLSSFILSFLFISTIHMHARRSVWILVPSALPISPYVVAVRLKPTVHASPHINAARELAAVHLMRRQQLSPKIFLGLLPV